MKMKSAVVISGLLMLSLGAQAQMAVIQDSTEFARVLNYSPMPGPQVPRQVCTPVTVTQERVYSNGSNVGVPSSVVYSVRWSARALAVGMAAMPLRWRVPLGGA